ncbi:accessory gene regulator protein AgrB [Aneurinibacillus soli]|uniref:Putative accessory gene regulator protein n=1 Tax=Aneurinibacillus soli TaxID=1500254 RepID=A0A0U5BDT3_9BACL|nr:accessory gene regulator B family protein [Aneurinibacillus soli]PYE61950.1 accessory gene regulator protein AgrB [Aneurinibacillus soli]BAU29766.1 putative accessory gene regulator protein [Aneurinibacillus soli]
MSKKLADSIAGVLVEQSHTQHSEAVLSYGLQIMINSILKISVITFAGWALHLLPEMYVMILSFGILRMITGGVHAHTFVRCLSISSISFILLSLLVSPTLPYFFTHTSAILFAFIMIGLLTTWVYVPGSWGNRKFSARRIQQSKILSLSILLIVCTAVGSYLPSTSYPNLLWAAILGMTWQYILVTPPGYAFYRVIERTVATGRG